MSSLSQFPESTRSELDNDQLKAQGYALTDMPWTSDDLAKRYLALIERDQALYPENIQKILQNLVEAINSCRGHDLDLYPRLIQISRLARLYRPKDKSNTECGQLFLTGLYWSRYLRPEQSQLQSLQNHFNLIDLYLIPANPFDRYPARKLLSYYCDDQLYLTFGRIGQYYYPKTYQSKQHQLDGLVALSVYRFGHFQVKTWSRPVQLVWYQYDQPFQANARYLSLDDLLAAMEWSEDRLIFRFPDRTRSNFLFPLLRLALMVLSSGQLLPDPDSWVKFLGQINRAVPLLYQEYQDLRQHPHQLELSKNPLNNQILHLPLTLDSVEQSFHWCILCLNPRSSDNLGLCGHGVCLTCQIMLKTVRCPFCSEHFTNRSEDILSRLSDHIVISSIDQDRLKQRIDWLNQERTNRDFKFDWANLDYRLFRWS